MEANAKSVAVFSTKPYDRSYILSALGSLDLNWHFHDFRLEPTTARAAEGAHAACIFVNDNANREVLSALADLGIKHIALRCAGYNNIDLAAAAEFGIAVTRVPSYSPHAVSEHAIALLLSLNRKIHRAYNRAREFNFSLHGLVGFDLFGKTVGVIGTGKTGRLVAETLRGFKMRVLASDIYPDADWAAANDIEYVSNDTLFEQSHVVTLHTPLTPETDHLIDEDAIARMKPGVVIINVSRGRLIHTKALIEALKSGHIGGVALDVYEEEEGVFFEDLSGQIMQNDELALLLTLPNVLVTAHQAFLTHEALTEIARVTVENIIRLGKSQPPLESTALQA